MHTFRKVVNAEGVDVYQVGFAGGADVLDARQFIVLAEYETPSDAAGLVSYLNGGSGPATLPSAAREGEEEEEHSGKRARGGHR